MIWESDCSNSIRWAIQISAMDLNDGIEKILWCEQQISERVSELSSQLTRDFEYGTVSPVLVGVATGAFIFLADLVRKIQLPITVDFIRVDSYGSGTVSNDQPRMSLDLKVDVNGKHVILVWDPIPIDSDIVSGVFVFNVCPNSSEYVDFVLYVIQCVKMY